MSSDPAPATPTPQRYKRRTLILLVGVLVLAFLLSTGITGLQLLPGQLFSLNLAPAGQPAPTGAWQANELILLFMRVMLALALVLFPINLIVVLLTREGRRRLLINLIAIVLLWLWLPALTQIVRNLAEEQQAGAGGPGSANELPPLPALPNFVPDPSDWTVLAVTLALALLLVGLVAAIAWLIWRYRRRRDKPLAQLSQQAQAALEALQSGGDFKSIVIRCYRDMSHTLQQERGIERGVAMTPSEFEHALQGKGLPPDAVHALTRAFEDVRYGGRPATEREERLAMDSLTAIVAACQRPRGAHVAQNAQSVQGMP